MNWFDLLKETWHEFNEDRAQRLGAALAYYVFFSLFPLILLLISLIGYALSAGWPAAWDARAFVLDMFQRTVPAIGDPLRERIVGIIEARGALGLVGTATLLWSASNIFAQLDEAFDLLFDVKPQQHAFLTSVKARILNRLLAVVLVLAVVLLLLLAAILSTVLNALVTFTETFPGSELFWPGFNVALSFVITAGIFTLMFKFLPATYVSWRAALLGGGLTAVAWEIGEQLLAWYLTRSNYSEAYGVIGSVMALLVWTYYAGQILFLGGEFTSVYNSRLLEAGPAKAEAKEPAASPEARRAISAPRAFLLGVVAGIAAVVGGIGAGVRQLGRRILR